VRAGRKFAESDFAADWNTFETPMVCDRYLSDRIARLRLGSNRGPVQSDGIGVEIVEFG
jgi:hypothetical protein